MNTGKRRGTSSESSLASSDAKTDAKSQNHSQLGSGLGHIYIAVCDADGNPLYVTRPDGYDAADEQASSSGNPFETIEPEALERMKWIVGETVEFGKGRDGEYRAQQKDGTVRLVELQSKVLLDAQGKRSGIVVISRDVTEAKGAMTGVRSMVEATSGWLWEIDLEGVYTYASPKVKELLGYDLSDILGRRPAEFVVPEEAASLSEKIHGLIVERKPIVNLETRKLHKDGRIVFVETNAIPIVDDNGRLHRYEGIDRDITERKKVEEQLRKLSRAVEQSPASIIITDTRGDIEYVNPRFCELTGYSREEAIGRNPRILKSGDMPVEGYKRLWDTIASGQEWRGEFHNRKKNGEPYWEFASISPIRDADGNVTHYLAVKEDVTERKRVEEERLKLLYELQQALAKVKTLSGLLPICAWCKKVRDDEGYWKQIESYVEAHSDAEFTHGICPDCAQKMHIAQTKAARNTPP